MKKLLLFILLVCATVQAYSQEYPKVVLSGDDREVIELVYGSVNR